MERSKEKELTKLYHQTRLYASSLWTDPRLIGGVLGAGTGAVVGYKKKGVKGALAGTAIGGAGGAAIGQGVKSLHGVISKNTNKRVENLKGDLRKLKDLKGGKLIGKDVHDFSQGRKDIIKTGRNLKIATGVAGAGAIGGAGYLAHEKLGKKRNENG